jgi:hypothetical protein
MLQLSDTASTTTSEATTTSRHLHQPQSTRRKNNSKSIGTPDRNSNDNKEAIPTDNRNTSTNETVTRATVRKKNRTYHQGITDEKVKTTQDGTQNTEEQPNTG